MTKRFQLQPLTCANCGAPLNPGPQGALCAYCGTLQILVDTETPTPAPEDASGDACVYRGIQAYAAGAYLTTVRELEQALTLQTQRYSIAEILTIMGNAHDELTNYPAAISCYRRALDADARFYRAWVGLGITYRHQSNYDAAESCYRQALSLEPGYGELHASLGALYIFKNDIERAIQSLEHAIRLNPSMAIAYGNLALAYAMAQRFDEAESCLRQAVALGYKNHQTIRERIAALKTLG